MKPETYRYPNLETLSRAAAEYICDLAEESVQQQGGFSIALAGGHTPKSLYENLARHPIEARMPWPKIHVFWGDERCVPPDHPDSNYRMASFALISQVPIPPQNVHRIPVDKGSPEQAAEGYEKVLREFFGHSIEGNAPERPSAGNRQFTPLDLILLGIGKDGHTASLFPGDALLEEKDRWVASVGIPRGSPPVPRVTMTLPMINRARRVMFLASGVEKRDVVSSILNDPNKARRLYPAARIQPQGKLVWFLDDETLG